MCKPWLERVVVATLRFARFVVVSVLVAKHALVIEVLRHMPMWGHIAASDKRPSLLRGRISSGGRPGRPSQIGHVLVPLQQLHELFVHELVARA